MSHVVSVEPELDFDLVYDDGEPMESNWHRIEMNLFIDVPEQAMAERGRNDFFAGGNMFIYYSLEQARTVAREAAEKKRHFRGPDFFFVAGVERHDRKAWVVWDEQGRYPDSILELLSASTVAVDRGVKKTLYERTFRTPEYFLYDPEEDVLEGFQLIQGVYRPILPDSEGRLESGVLGLRLGRWRGIRSGIETVWLRLYDAAGRLIPTAEEAERQRADVAEAEVRRLQSLLASRNG